MNCPYCGNELEYEDADFCPKCGKSLSPKEDEMLQETVEAPQTQTEFLLAAALLTMISATFVASLGYLGVYQYVVLLEYYDSSVLLGFLIFGVAGIIAAAFGLAGSVFMLKRKLFTFTIPGTVFPLVSVFVTLLCIQQYGYGLTDVMIFAEVAAAMFSFISIMLNFASRKEYN